MTYTVRLILLFCMLFAVPRAAQAEAGSWEWNGYSMTGNSALIKELVSRLPQVAEQNIVLPVLSVERSSITPNFGDMRGGGRKHEGQDIMAPRFSPIISPTEAVVTNTGDGASSGLFVATANPGGESFIYMHLEKIADGIHAGKLLRKGDVLGYVGDSGNARGAGTHLHFEIRKNGATDPYPRLTLDTPLSEKILYINNNLLNSQNPENIASEIVPTMKQALLSAQNMHIAISSYLEKALSNTALPTENKNTSIIKPMQSVPLPSYFGLGEKSESVATLQQYLIKKNIGKASQALAQNGASGYFGNLTKSALIEFQKASGITPATGYYGPLTKAYIETKK